MMRERPVRFGPDNCLTGIISEGSSDASRGARPALLMVNAGLVHHVGPARMHVVMSRRLAPRGTLCLRFDLSGMGDSGVRRDATALENGAVRDVEDAMDFVSATYGIGTFIIFGICDGARVAFEAAKTDPRIVGLVSIDGYAYRTPRYYWEYYAPRVLRLRSWRNFVRERLRRATKALRRGRAPDVTSRQPSTFRVQFPRKEQVADELAGLTVRGVRQLYIFTSAHARHYNYRRQFSDAFPAVGASPLVRVTFWPDTGHMFEGLDAQETFLDEIVTWADGLGVPERSGPDAPSSGQGPEGRAEVVL